MAEGDKGSMLRGRVFYVFVIDRFSCICLTTPELRGLDVVVYGLRLSLARMCVALVGLLHALFVLRHGLILMCICEYKSNNRMHWLDVRLP